MSLATAFTIRAGGPEWEPNPILLKELRQAMRNNFLVGSLMFLLGALSLLWAAYLTRLNLFPQQTAAIGLQISRAFLAVATAISLLFVPLYSGTRLAAERHQPGFELMFATGLPGWKMVRGKFLTAAYLQLMFFSIVLPFMAITGLLQGVDVPTVLFLITCFFIVGCIAVQAAIMCAYIPVPLAGTIIIGLLFTNVLLGVGAGLLSLSFKMLGAGIGALMDTAAFWVCSLVFVLLSIGAYLLLYGVSAALAVKERQLRRYSKQAMKELMVMPEEIAPEPVIAPFR